MLDFQIDYLLSEKRNEMKRLIIGTGVFIDPTSFPLIRGGEWIKTVAYLSLATKYFPS